MAGKPWRLKPALYTTSLIYISIQVAVLSFLSSYYDYGVSNFTQWALERLEEFDYTREKLAFVNELWEGAKDNMKIRSRQATEEDVKVVQPEVQLGEEMQILNAEQLSLFDGTRASRPVYLAILGRIYNVDKGRKHYGKGGGYHFFAGRDATRAFVSGDFTEKGLVDHTDGLSHEDLLGIRDWISFYEKDYKLVGVLIGRYYDANGQPTEELRSVLGRMQTAAEWRASKAAEAEVFPPCNSEWHQNSGGRVWCSMKSGGIQRDWAGVPRLLYDPNTKQQRCACVKNFGPGLSAAGSKGSNRGDLDHPNLKAMTDTKIEDLRLPPLVVSRIVDRAVGPDGTVSKEARTAIARAASVFILNITSYANEYALTKKRKAMTPEDIYQALQVVECDHIVGPLQNELEAWKVNKAQKSEETRKRKAEKKAAARASGDGEGSFMIAPSEEMRLRSPDSDD